MTNSQKGQCVEKPSKLDTGLCVYLVRNSTKDSSKYTHLLNITDSSQCKSARS